MLLSLSPTQTRTCRQWWASPGVYPYDDLTRLFFPSVKHSHLIQLFSPTRCHAPYSWPCTSPHFACPGLVLPATGCQRLCQHAHQLLSVELPAGDADYAPPGSVFASSIHRLCPPCLTHPSLPGPYTGHLQAPAVSISSTHECDECNKRNKCQWRAEAAICDYMRGFFCMCVCVLR